MILILSKEDYERSTEDVMDWIDALGGSYLRFNGEDLDGKNSWKISINHTSVSFEVSLNNVTFNNEDIDVVWYRRPHGLKKFTYLAPLQETGYSIKDHLKKEIFALSQAFYQFLDHAFWMDKPLTTQIGKIKQLLEAKTIGLDIPQTLITNNLNEITQFGEKFSSLITKSIGEGTSFTYNNKTYILYTQAIPEDIKYYIPDIMFPSLVQERLLKKYELRIFYLNGLCHTMAIFSQQDDQTKVDFRRYNNMKPNRFVPFKLPTYLEQKIVSLMSRLGLTTGSIDMVKTIDNRYVFLEINPLGQFGMVSGTCNYHLEKKIATYLIKKNEERSK